MIEKNKTINNRRLIIRIKITVLLASFFLLGNAQNLYTIDASVVPSPPREGHLRLGGEGRDGHSIYVNNKFITRNGKPWVPITGEFHYCRYASRYWDESLKKMKAGGINTVATYVFWNIHERKEGEFDWEENRNLREFIRLCSENDLFVIVRIGPFAHGEIRNGGLPDWLLGKPLVIRSNDPTYLAYVERLYTAIAGELEGLYYKDGGPIVGIQLENEYQHSAAPWALTYPGQPHDMTASERDLAVTQEGVGIAKGDNPYSQLGNDHMKVLKELAVGKGMVTPLYTATGWGNAAIVENESIPVTAAYAYPFWTPGRDISPFFLYKDMHRNPDYAPVRYQPEDYPVFPAELGSGIMTVYSRRPIVEHKSFDAMINRCLGSGANGIGYYMYHGGSTPKDGAYFFSDEAYGLPKISYDFQAPVGEYGQVREGYYRLKLMHQFLHDFGDRLCAMQTILPENASIIEPENITDLRYAVRSDGNSGFLFLNNFQDDTVMVTKRNLQFAIHTGQGVVKFPLYETLDLPVDENLILPFNFDMDGVKLMYATAQLLAKGGDAERPFYVFFTPDDGKAEFAFDGDIAIRKTDALAVRKEQGRTIVTTASDKAEFTLIRNNRKVDVLVLWKKTALDAYIVDMKEKKSVVFSDNPLIHAGDSITIYSRGDNTMHFEIYPTSKYKVDAGNATLSTRRSASNSSSAYTVAVPAVELPVSVTKVSEKKFMLRLPKQPTTLSNVFLEIDYVGDTAMGFINSELVADEFYKGVPWEIGLRDFMQGDTDQEMVLYFRPLQKNATYLKDLDPKTVPDFSGAPSLFKLQGVKYIPEYKTVINFK
ncbi:beta-galactosidase [Sphingobacterium sp. DN00404]|uniref:Beta-galactosidase n=1 Tax=Sphingobacterium micropteri TaxID=2763501 RepID=A0ABR7YP88_9SPHI|nr:beta-galactosidase [Sphingobacterium micropteri]MBD1433107.1 beta-galactosidase [Sphingobacterium micropteri]